MFMLGVLLAFSITAIAVATGIGLRRVIAAGLRYRGRRVVTCPENQRPAGVAVDVWHAAWTAPMGNPKLRLAGCSRWPERSDCGQECRGQIQPAAADCRPDQIWTHWYDGKYCAWCGQPVSQAYWTSCKPVVLTGEKALRQWDEISISEMPEVMASAVPVCFSCYARALPRLHQATVPVT